MRLGDGRQTWHPTRKQLGVGYAPGGSDASPAGGSSSSSTAPTLRAYFNSIAPYVRRAPKNAMSSWSKPVGDDEGMDAGPGPGRAGL